TISFSWLRSLVLLRGYFEYTFVRPCLFLLMTLPFKFWKRGRSSVLINEVWFKKYPFTSPT
ncbi:MAG: hypothetical protein WAL66_11950, partial [Nitrososphaeraceae archaeon]